MRRLVPLLAALAVALAACGGDDDGSAESERPKTEAEAVEQAVVTYLTSNDCDVLTDKFLKEQVLIDPPRERQCMLYEETGASSNIDEDEVELSKPEISGTKATIVQTVGATETEYALVRQGTAWRIDAADQR